MSKDPGVWQSRPHLVFWVLVGLALWAGIGLLIYVLVT